MIIFLLDSTSCLQTLIPPVSNLGGKCPGVKGKVSWGRKYPGVNFFIVLKLNKK